MKRAIEASTSSTYMPAAPIAARCQRLGSIQESETLQYRQGVSTRNMTPISWHSPPKCLQDRPWPNSCRTLVTHSVKREPQPVLCAEEVVEIGQPRVEHVELHDDERQRQQRRA